MLRTDRIGCGQITWRGADEATILAQIARAGYRGAPLTSGSPDEHEAIRARYAAHGLALAPGYFSAAFWKRDARPRILADAREYARLSRSLGLAEMYVSVSGTQDPMPSGRTRWQAAGHVTPADSLPREDFRFMAETLNAVGEASGALGIRTCFHNHVGTPVETEEEIERLIELLDPTAVFLGPDTGHLMWAGIDPLVFVARHMERVLTLHIKDVKASVVQAGRKWGWSYAQTVEAGVWTELGAGCVDFPGLFRLLGARDFQGWIIVETDVTPLPSPYESAYVNRQYLRRFEAS